MDKKEHETPSYCHSIEKKKMKFGNLNWSKNITNKFGI